MPRPLRTTHVVLLALAMVTCGPPPRVSLSQQPRNYSADDYPRVQERWSRHASPFHVEGLTTPLIVDATYLSSDFRSAYVARYAHDATLNEAQRQQQLAASLDRLAQEHEFYVALETDRSRWGQLNRNFTAWHARLIDDRGREVEPMRIEPERRLSASDVEYFPYTSPWRQVFRLHFPRRALDHGTEYEVLGAGTRYFVLRLAGALGTVDLRWDVAEHG
jgi:hypothetical protein